MKVTDFDGQLNQFLVQYSYQPNLTNYLDHLNEARFSQSLLNEVVLWKVNRFVRIEAELLNLIDGLAALNAGEHRQAEGVLLALLETRGIDLSMASTILRFRNPSVFQIIDRHAYRSVYDDHYPLYPCSPPARKVFCYFDYIDELIRLCQQRHLAFITIDRLLYEFDKKINGGLRKSASLRSGARR